MGVKISGPSTAPTWPPWKFLLDAFLRPGPVNTYWTIWMALNCLFPMPGGPLIGGQGRALLGLQALPWDMSLGSMLTLLIREPLDMLKIKLVFLYFFVNWIFLWIFVLFAYGDVFSHFRFRTLYTRASSNVFTFWTKLKLEDMSLQNGWLSIAHKRNRR